MFQRDAVKDVVDVGRLAHRAVEIGRQMLHTVLGPDPADLEHPSKIPVSVVAAQLDLETFQTVALDPIGEQHRITIVRFCARQLGVIQRVKSANQVPREQPVCASGQKEVARIPAGEAHGRVRSRSHECREVPSHPFRAVSIVNRAPMKLSVGVVHRLVEHRAADQRSQPGHRFASTLR